MKKINILIPMAGHGSRFTKQGYQTPKPFIEIAGKPMIQHVMEAFCIQSYQPHYIFVVKEEFLQDENCRAHIEKLKQEFSVDVCVDKWICGQAASSLAAHRFINNDDPLLISGCDEAISIDIDAMMQDVEKRQLDGMIPTFYAEEDRWSFVKVDGDGVATETAEKKLISNNATIGWYFFSKGRDFISATLDMFADNNNRNGEFYVCPAYNYLIQQGKRIGIMDVPESTRVGLGTPEEVEKYLNQIAG